MAKGGGGAWKVAYADFVTAMMAFFLVMWICSQDQKIKESVAHYFLDPMGVTPMGSTKQSGPTGSILDSPSNGTVPKAQSTSVGRGRNSYSSASENDSRITKLVGDWIHADENIQAYWKEQARRQRQLASQTKEVRQNPDTIDNVAKVLLAKQLREELVKGTSTLANSLHQDLLIDMLTVVNWGELAEDLLHN